MEAIFKRKNQLIEWLESMFDKVIYWAKKNVRKLKGKPPEKTAWQIIKLLA